MAAQIRRNSSSDSDGNLAFQFMGEGRELVCEDHIPKVIASVKPSSQSLDKETPVIWVSQLTPEEGEKIRAIDVGTR